MFHIDPRDSEFKKSRQRNRTNETKDYKLTLLSAH
jgi:hypothetical protein